MERATKLKIILGVLFVLLIITYIGSHIEYKIYINRIKMQMIEIIDQTQVQIENANNDERTINQELSIYPNIEDELLPIIGSLTDEYFFEDINSMSDEKCISELNAYLGLYLNSSDRQIINSTIDELIVVTENEIIRGYFEGQETLYTQRLIYEALMTTDALLEEIDNKFSMAEKKEIDITTITYNNADQTVELFNENGTVFASVKLQTPELIPNDYVTETILGMRPTAMLKKTKLQERKETIYQLFVYLGIKVDHHGNLEPSLFSTLAVGDLTELYLSDDQYFKNGVDDFFDKEVRGNDKETAFRNMFDGIYWEEKDINRTVIYPLHE